MNLKSFLAAVVVALSPMAATAVTINIEAGGDTATSNAGTFLGTVNDIAFNVTGIATDDFLLGRLESRVIITELFQPATATVEIIHDYVNLKDSSLINIGSRAEVADIVGIEPVLNPVRGSLDVAHFISFDGGTTETQLADFLFGGLTGVRTDSDTIGNLGSYQLRSLFTFEPDPDRLPAGATVTGDILVRPAVPAPASILLIGTVWAGFGLMRRKAKKAA